uniref:Calcineurin-like phosphoesterase domain-containing protein n=1 Tax=Arcella intermedia TaxID=1963864 RepID=A0A6B2LIE7_9EUKA
MLISDTHNMHHALHLPPPDQVDLLIHAGDFCTYGNEEHINSFNSWLATLHYKHKVVIAGNHENSKQAYIRQRLTNAVFLEHASYDCEGFLIFGTKFFWKCPHGNAYYDQIPSHTDVLVAHMPAEGYFDGCYGCPTLKKRLMEIRPKLFVCGHIHGAYGCSYGSEKDGLGGTFIANASQVGPGDSEITDHKPILIEIRKTQ